MKRLILLPLIAILFIGCANTQNKAQAPSTAAVQSKVTKANVSVSAASDASKRSSEKIKEFRTNAEIIDFKATRILELL